jgi:hypothetical protein
MAENLLGFSTRASQDLMYFAPLLLPAEAALLALGAVLLVWHWRHPAAFLMLLSGCGVLLVGGTLALYEGSYTPFLAHWTPALPVFYATLALPVGIWAQRAWAGLPRRLNWAAPAAMAVGLAVLAWLNINFYFHEYYADDHVLKSELYRTTQQGLDLRTAESRYQAALGPDYVVRIVGQNSDPNNPDTRYLVADQDQHIIADPDKELPHQNSRGKPLAFILLPGSERYRERVQSIYPGGTPSEVRSRAGEVLFYTYVVAHPQP